MTLPVLPALAAATKAEQGLVDALTALRHDHTPYRIEYRAYVAAALAQVRKARAEYEAARAAFFAARRGAC